MRTSLLLLIASIGLAQQGTALAQEKNVVVEIKNLDGQSVGRGVLSPAQPKGVKLDLTITNLPPGEHAFHIHQKPVCDASEEFNSALLHFDPTHEMYGDPAHNMKGGGHSAGNPMRTVQVGPDGTGKITVVFPALTMGDDDHSILANGGTAIMFHAAAGAKGPTRIACGVITRSNSAAH